MHWYLIRDIWSHLQSIFPSSNHVLLGLRVHVLWAYFSFKCGRLTSDTRLGCQHGNRWWWWYKFIECFRVNGSDIRVNVADLGDKFIECIIVNRSDLDSKIIECNSVSGWQIKEKKRAEAADENHQRERKKRKSPPATPTPTTPTTPSPRTPRVSPLTALVRRSPSFGARRNHQPETRKYYGDAHYGDGQSCKFRLWTHPFWDAFPWEIEGNGRV